MAQSQQGKIIAFADKGGQVPSRFHRHQKYDKGACSANREKGEHEHKQKGGGRRRLFRGDKAGSQYILIFISPAPART
jgi:hypothetical protein